jgi:hypothetical protein
MATATKKESERKRQQARRDKENEVGQLPKCQDAALRKACSDSLLTFLVELFEDKFPDPFGRVQLESIAHEEAVLSTGVGAINKLEPRGYGKSTRSILAAVWACLTGRQDFVMVCCDSVEKSSDLLLMAHRALDSNAKLLDAFPEVWPFHKLDANSHRANYQTYSGERTDISIKGDTIQFPRLGGKFASEGRLIVSRPFRKARGKNVDGRRPTVVILDDVQSSEEAGSPTSVRKNLKTLTSDIAYLGSRRQPAAVINNATVIQPDDFPSKVADLPAFTTVRYRMVDRMPDDTALWEKYQGIRSDYVTDNPDDRSRAARDALAFYKAHRDQMDAGAVVTWDHAYSTAKHEISTIQAAQNFIADYGLESFQSECQNEPPKEEDAGGDITADQIATKQHAQPRNVPPLEAETVVAMIDVQGDVLFETIMAGNAEFTAWVLDYGTFPRQRRRHYTKAKLGEKLSKLFKNTTETGRIYQGIRRRLAELSEMRFRRHGDGAELQLAAIGVDARYQTETVRKAIRDHGDPRVVACYGHGITARRAPLNRWPIKGGEKDGPYWRLQGARRNDNVRSLLIDTNHYKKFAAERWGTPLGDPSSLSVFKAEAPSHHRLYAEHQKSEIGALQRDESNGRAKVEFTARPGVDNDMLDTTVGCLALLSLSGSECVGAELPRRQPRKKRKVRYG